MRWRRQRRSHRGGPFGLPPLGSEVLGEDILAPAIIARGARDRRRVVGVEAERGHRAAIGVVSTDTGAVDVAGEGWGFCCVGPALPPR